MNRIDSAGTTAVRIEAKASARLNYREAVRSPCETCDESPCCTHLLLCTSTVKTLGDVDYMLYLTNFEGILLDVDRKGQLRVFFNQACRHLDRPSGLCGVHSTPEQPSICVHYSAHSCRYRPRMAMEVDPVRPFLDRARAMAYAQLVTFDDERRVADLPDWDTFLGALGGLPLQKSEAPPPEPDPVLEEWRAIVLGEKPREDGYSDHRFSDPVVSEPCSGCEAYCCTTLVFEHEIPENAASFDFVRYCLGFPGVEIAFADDCWNIVVRTRCRHLDGNRCSVYGEPERPLRCGNLDGLRCGYRSHIGRPFPPECVRITRREYPVLEASVVFDEQGRVRRVPTVEKLRHILAESVTRGAI